MSGGKSGRRATFTTPWNQVPKIGSQELAESRPPHSPGGLYGGARSEGGRISATGGKFWAKRRILWGIASGASGLSPPQAENFFENDAFKEKIY